MKTKKIAVQINKGGTGKSTTSVNLAAGLAEKGKRVLLVDTDTQGHLAPMLGVDPVNGLCEFVLGQRSFDEAAVEVRKNLHLLAGGRELAGLKQEISRQDVGSQYRLKEALETIEGKFDYVIVDTAPGWDSLNVNVLFYAGEVLTPINIEVLTLKSLTEFLESLARIRKYKGQGESLRWKYALPTFADRRVRKTSEVLEQLKEFVAQNYGETILCEPIRYSVRLSEAPGFGQTIYEYAPGTNGARDYQTLSERILKNGK